MIIPKSAVYIVEMPRDIEIFVDFLVVFLLFSDQFVRSDFLLL